MKRGEGGFLSKEWETERSQKQSFFKGFDVRIYGRLLQLLGRTVYFLHHSMVFLEHLKRIESL